MDAIEVLLMSNNTRDIEGCEACKRGAYSGAWPPPERVAVHEAGPTFLHKCEQCGTYWHFDLRFANPISEAEARRLYHDYFAKK